jgi:hypothetical protein
MAKHYKTIHPHRVWEAAANNFIPKRTAFSRACACYEKKFTTSELEIDSQSNGRGITIEGLLSREEDGIRRVVMSHLQTDRSLRYSIIVFAQLSKPAPPPLQEEGERDINNPILTLFKLRSKQQLLVFAEPEKFEAQMATIASQLAERLQDLLTLEGSGWNLEYFSCLHLEVSE